MSTHTRLELDRNNKGNAFIGATDFNDAGFGVRSYVLSGGEDYIADAVMERRFEDMKRLMAGNLESAVVMPNYKKNPTLPEWERLMKLPVTHLYGEAANTAVELRLEVHYPAETNFADVRLWTARGAVADGEPFEHTVYVEVRDVIGAEIMPGANSKGTEWYDLGHYDGDNPPEALPGLSAKALHDMVNLPEPGEGD